MQKPVLSIVVPCFNEEEVLVESSKNLIAFIELLIQKEKIDQKSFICFVDDGSRDGSWKIISGLNRDRCKGIRLSCNFGHQNALLAGMYTFKENYDVVITIDADLQDDCGAIENMIDEYSLNNSEIVYGVRNNRRNDTVFKKATAQGFYKIMQFLGVGIIYNHADFRLASKRVVDELIKFDEVNVFLRALFPLIGFNSSLVYYERKVRKAGKTKYPFIKMVNFALDGITSFSVKPLRIISLTGVLVFCASIGLIIYAACSYLFFNAVHGWASTVIPIYFIGGIQILCIGIIGEYLGKVYKEVKHRPNYIIEKVFG